jgi:acyl dehydratase
MLSVVDRGADKGMFASFERVIHDQASGTPLASIIQVNGCRGDGGCGSAGTPPGPLPRPPGEPPDATLDIAIPSTAAALYRLNGDLNPLHIDPAAAAKGGFPRPILHGLCTFGYAGLAIGRMAGMPDAIAARFSAPFFPGETLMTEIWHRDGQVRFNCRALERDTVVLDCGVASISQG